LQPFWYVLAEPVLVVIQQQYNFGHSSPLPLPKLVVSQWPSAGSSQHPFLSPGNDDQWAMGGEILNTNDEKVAVAKKGSVNGGYAKPEMAEMSDEM